MKPTFTFTKGIFVDEKLRRDKEDSIFVCICKEVLIGRNITYNEHLETCPVFLEAKKILKN